MSAMWIRSAFWIGTPKPGREEHFRDQIDRVMVPAMSAFPGVQDVKALWPQQREAELPDDRAGMELILASRERRTLRPRVLELMAAFDGHLAHIDYEVSAAPDLPAR